MAEPRVVLVEPLGERFWSKVDKRGPGECWEWTASKQTKGYGQFTVGGRTPLAHRLVYELLIGPIPAGLQIDHLCRNRACVNPAHLEPVTRQENILRGEGFAATNNRKTKCPHGHAYAGENLYVYPGRRVCRACRREANRRYRQRMVA